MSPLLDEIADDLLRKGHSVRFVAEGDSMHPSIRSGDVLLIEPLDPARLAPGDVVLFRAARGLTAHRVVATRGHSLTTRGDNSLRSDAPVEHRAVLGRVTAIERNGARLPATRSFLAGIYARAVLRAIRRFIVGRRSLLGSPPEE